MPSVLAEVEQLVIQALQSAFPGQQEKPMVAATRDSKKFGADYQCNNAMSLFGKLKGKVSIAPESLIVNALTSAYAPETLSSRMNEALMFDHRKDHPPRTSCTRCACTTASNRRCMHCACRMARLEIRALWARPSRPQCHRRRRCSRLASRGRAL